MNSLIQKAKDFQPQKKHGAMRIPTEEEIGLAKAYWSGEITSIQGAKAIELKASKYGQESAGFASWAHATVKNAYKLGMIDINLVDTKVTK